MKSNSVSVNPFAAGAFHFFGKPSREDFESLHSD